MSDVLHFPQDGLPLAGTTRLGVSMHAVLQEPSARRQQDTLRAAYDAGYRHFDVAPLYGLGLGEERLGQFLAQHDDCTVVTKIGLLPGRAQRVAALAQRPVRAALKTVPGLRSALHRVQPGSGAVRTPAPSPEELRASAERSLQRLRVDVLDALLTHEVHWDEEWTRLWTSLRDVADGTVRAFGLDGPAALLRTYPSDVTANAEVVQFPGFEGAPPAAAGSRRIVWGLLEDADAVAVALRSGGGEAAVRGLVGSDGSDLRTAALIAATAFRLADDPRALVLVESSEPATYAAVWRGTATALTHLADEAQAAAAREALDQAVASASPRS